MLRIALAEIVGTFIIVFLGTGSMMLNEFTRGEVTDLGVCLIWGFAVFLAIVVAERIGQGHFNPALTIAAAVKEKTPISTLSLRIVVQFVAAIMASMLLRSWCPSIKTLGETLPTVPIWQVFLIEVIISFGLMATIEISLAKKFKLTTAAVLIGAYVCVAAYIAGPYTGASMNPARTLGPGIVNSNFAAFWVYMTAPVVGMLLALPMKKRYLSAQVGH